MKKITCLFLLVAALGACTPKRRDIRAESPKQLALASGWPDSDRHCRKRLLSGKGETHTSFESR